jgi:hypothetical protein
VEGHAASGRAVGLVLRSVETRSRDELEVALAAIGKDLPDALLTFTEGLTIGLRQRIGSFALANRLPMISEVREFAEAGGLATYGMGLTGFTNLDKWRSMSTAS